MVTLRIRQRRVGTKPGECPYCGAPGVRFALGWIPSLRPLASCHACRHRPVLDHADQRRHTLGFAILTGLALLGIIIGLLLAALLDRVMIRYASVLGMCFWWWYAQRQLFLRSTRDGLLAEQEDPFIDALHEAVTRPHEDDA